MTLGRDTITGVLLAGGQSRRMFAAREGGGDKGLLELHGRPMIAHVRERLGAQVGAIVLNANGDPARFASLGLPVAPDTVEGFVGPLAGVLAGLRWSAANAPQATHIATVSTDAPFIPNDLVTRLASALSFAVIPPPSVLPGGAGQQSARTRGLSHSDIDKDPGSSHPGPGVGVRVRGDGGGGMPPLKIALAASDGEVHPVIGLWPVALADDLEAALKDGVRKVLRWTDRHGTVVVEFPFIELNGRRIDPFFNANTPEELAEARALLG